MFVPIALAMQLVTPTGFATLDHPGADPLLVADLRGACPSSIANDRAALLKLEEKQADRHLLGNDPEVWVILGCTRALLSVLGATSHDGPLMIAGDSWAQGAMNSFERALALRSADRRAADLLAILAMNEPEPRGYADIAIALDRAAAAGAVGSATLRGCAEFGIRSGHPEITRRCGTRALREGKDSTWHLLLLARLDFRAADSVAGTRDFLRAAAAASDTLAKLALAWHLQWFVSPAERAQWASLSGTPREAWLRDILASRDVRDGRAPGARLAEHFKRLEYVDSAFRLAVPKMLRTSMLTKPSVGLPPSSVGSAVLTPTPTNLSDMATMLADQPFRDYMRWQVDFDDRGVTWMRYGKPLKTPVGPDIEVWYYEIDGNPLLVTFAYEEFSGSVAPSRFVTGRIGDVYCGVDSRRCVLGMRQTVPPELIRQIQEQDREYISVATTRDDNSIRTDKAIEVIARLHRLWDPITSAEIALVTYAVKSKDLVVQHEGAALTARVEFELRRWDAEHERFLDTAFTRRFTTTLDNPRHLTGFLVTPSSATTNSWSIVATQSANRRGRAWDVTSGPLDRGDQAISDLVLGQGGQGVAWTNHNVSIPLAPLNAVDRALPVSLYYQIRSTTARAGLRTTVALYRMDGTVARDTAAMQLGYEQSVQSGINEVAPTIDVSRLEKGAYRLEVRLADERGAIVSRRTVQLNLE